MNTQTLQHSLQSIKHDSHWVYPLISSLKNRKAATLPSAIYPKPRSLNQLPDFICSPNSLTLCHMLFWFNTREKLLFSRLHPAFWSTPKYPKHVSATLIYKCSVSVNSVSIVSSCNRSCLDGTRWKEEGERQRSNLSLTCFTFPGGATLSVSGDLLLCLWHNFLLDPTLSGFGGVGWLVDLDTCVLSASKKELLPHYLSAPQTCFCVRYLWVP